MIDTVRGPFSKIEYQELNLNSHDQVKAFLYTQGWEPTEWNRVRDKETGEWRTTSPKLTEDSFASIKGEIGQQVARRNILVHRRRMIENESDPEGKGILSCIRDDGRVAATGVLCNTPTGRTTHREAVCNIPKAKEYVPYGREIRQIFCTNKEGTLLLGADLDQIEARITAHYASLFDGGEYWRIIQETGDIHQYNADLIKSDRDTAKSFQYAVYYGAGAPKVAKIIGCTVRQAEVHLKNFWGGNRGVELLKKNLEQMFERHNFIVGLDGRKIGIRAKYKCLNSCIQSAAGVIWKRWGTFANARIREAMIECPQIIAYHDEYQYRCEELAVPLATTLIKTAAVDAGRYFKLAVPITAEVKSGKDWSITH